MREEAYSKTLLLVDDNEINRHILENVFAPDYLSEHAWNGSIGLKKILAYPDKYCAVLLDVVMPEMDGIQLLRHLRARNLTDKIPIFLITAEASDAITKEAYELGVMDVISKPIIP